MTAANSPATAALSAFKIANNPFEAAQEKTVTIDVNAIVPVSDQSWHVEWTEKTNFPSGESSSEQWQATVTVQIVTPRTERALMVNPLGVYVTTFAWTQRLSE